MIFRYNGEAKFPASSVALLSCKVYVDPEAKGAVGVQVPVKPSAESEKVSTTGWDPLDPLTVSALGKETASIAALKRT